MPTTKETEAPAHTSSCEKEIQCKYLSPKQPSFGYRKKLVEIDPLPGSGLSVHLVGFLVLFQQ